MWKEVIVDQGTDDKSQCSRSLALDFNEGPSEYEAGVPTKSWAGTFGGRSALQYSPVAMHFMKNYF